MHVIVTEESYDTIQYNRIINSHSKTDRQTDKPIHGSRKLCRRRQFSFCVTWNGSNNLCDQGSDEEWNGI